MADPVGEVRAALAQSVDELRAANARTEALAEYQPARRVLLIRRAATMIPRGRVWRLGMVLLTTDGALLRTGQVTRAVEPKWANNQAVSAEIRRDYRAAAFTSAFPEGETVNFDTETVDLDADALRHGVDDPDAVLLLRDDVVQVRWSIVDRTAVMPFIPYLRERAALLISPPQGA